MEPPRFTVSEVTDMENKLRRVTIRLSDETLDQVKEELEHGNQCSMTATVILPVEMLPFVPGQTTGFAITGQP